VRILAFTGGAGNMYCGSCLRDNALAAGLLARGHDVILTPVYTPTRTDERNVSGQQVFFGGISVYLEQHSPLFRYTPRFLDRLWDSKWALNLATKRQIAVDPKSLGELTVSMLRGERGFQRKEIAKLLDWLRTEPAFDIVNLPYALLLGLAEPIKRELKVPICCTLQGEDLFLDGLSEPYRSQSIDLIRQAAAHVDLFLPVSRYYEQFMAEYVGIPRAKMRVVPLGINLDGYAVRAAERTPPFTIGYFARIAPEKGLHVLVEAFKRLRMAALKGCATTNGCTNVAQPFRAAENTAVAQPFRAAENTNVAQPFRAAMKLVAAGYLPPEHRGYLDSIRSSLRDAGLEHDFEYRGELDRASKIAFLQSLDVFSVPTTYREPKGLFLLEAMACGVPVVQPRVGAFPEIIEKTGGGIVVAEDDPAALADGIQQLMNDPARARQLGLAGAAGVRAHYTAAHMAEEAEAAYRDVARR
jgi:glycosyltransferase involved in cell wall biosynthesis